MAVLHNLFLVSYKSVKLQVPFGVNERDRLDITRPKDKTRSYASSGISELICFSLMTSLRTPDIPQSRSPYSTIHPPYWSHCFELPFNYL